MASTNVMKTSSSVFYTINVNAGVANNYDDSVYVTWSSNIKFGNWRLWGIGLNTYVNGSHVSGVTGACTSNLQTVCGNSGGIWISKTHSAQTIGFSASSYSVTVNGYGGVGATGTASGSFTIGAKTSYTVSYDANGGSGAPASQTKWHGENLSLSSTKPTKTGYTFSGWNTASNGSGTKYAPGGTYTANAGVKLYATWSANSKYLDVNGKLDGTSSGGLGKYGTFDMYINGSLKSNDANDYFDTHSYGTSYSIQDIKASPGYTYNGVSSGSLSGTIGTSDVSVVLSFSTNVYTVSYNTLGGSSAPSSQTKTYGQTITLSSVVPTMPGHIFRGWATSHSGSVAYRPGASYSANSSVSLYAVWEEVLDMEINLPDGTSIDDIYINLPDGASIDDIYINLPDGASIDDA